MPYAGFRPAIKTDVPGSHGGFWLGLALLILTPAVASVRGDRGDIAFIYIDANVGTASGGHTALKTGDTVYHFQNEQDYIRLVRDNWTRFRFAYNDRDNRSFHIARLNISTADAERIRDRLSLLFIVQNRHLDALRGLEQDVQLLDSLAQNLPARIRGIGFFERKPHQSAALHSLHTLIEHRLGPGYVSHHETRALRLLSRLRYTQSAIGDTPIVTDRYPTYPPSFSDQTEDLYCRWFALHAIEQGWPLRAGLLIDIDAFSSGSEPKQLSATERLWLTAYQNQLADSIIAQFQMPYTGGGPALLLAMARYQAVTESLASGHLLVMDVRPAPQNANGMPLDQRLRPQLLALRNEIGADLQDLRQTGLASGGPDESVYHRLERSASELREIQRGLATGHTLPLATRQGPPEGAGLALLPQQAFMGPEQWANARDSAEIDVITLRNQINASYAYHLVTRNCVTELVRAVNSAFTDSAAIRAGLGAVLEPGSSQGFIPFRFHELVRQYYRLSSQELLPSQRKRWLMNAAAQQGEASLAYLPESVTLMSSVYHSRNGDSAFLLFTDDVFWPRPAFGAVNLAYGVGAAGIGLLLSPFDHGAMSLEGLRGALFSLPELLWWNIRKGSFDEVKDPLHGGNAQQQSPSFHSKDREALRIGPYTTDRTPDSKTPQPP